MDKIKSPSLTRAQRLDAIESRLKRVIDACTGWLDDVAYALVEVGALRAVLTAEAEPPSDLVALVKEWQEASNTADYQRYEKAVIALDKWKAK